MAEPTTPAATERHSLHQVFTDRIVRHKLEQQGIEVEESWNDDSDEELIIWERIPPHLQGPVAVMRENALDLTDALLGALHSRLR